MLKSVLLQYPIRSYVRRGDRATKAQRHALQTYWKDYGIDVSNRLLDLDAIFRRKAPRVLEIGFGKGEVLIALAETNPDTDFIGIEVYLPGIGALLNKVKTKALSNIRIIHGDAVEVVPQYFTDHCLNKILILFPDPWPKKRHHKRRLIQTSFVDMLADKLCPGGILHLATDWDDYAAEMRAAVVESNRYQKMDIPSPRPMTVFEQRGKALSHPIHDMQYRALTVESCGKNTFIAQT